MARIELIDEQPLNVSLSEPQTLNESINPQENINVETTDGWYERSYTETDPIFTQSPASSITESDISNWDSKQDNLVSGTNIKTINNESLLGSGNITIQGGGGNAEWGSIGGTLSDQTDLATALNSKADTSSLSTVATSGSYNDLTNKPTIPTVPSTLSSFTDDLGSSPIHTHSQYLTQHQDISGKVDKETGKGLSSNDFTTTYKNNVESNTTARHTHSNKSVLDGISSSDITNWNGKISGITSSDVTTALGYTPEKEITWIETDGLTYDLADIKAINSTSDALFVDIKGAIDNGNPFRISIEDLDSGDMRYVVIENYEHLEHYLGQPESYSFWYMNSDTCNKITFTISGTSITTTTTQYSKQDTLVSGTNIKTINNTSLLGSGNITINDIKIITESSVRIWNMEDGLYMLPPGCKVYYAGETSNSYIPYLVFASVLFVSSNDDTGTNRKKTFFVFYHDKIDCGVTYQTSGVTGSFQQKLVSGTNIKTINNESLLGSGNINISGGLTIDDVYPVGSIYMSVSSTSPATLFGGTWQQIKDTFLLSCGDTYSNGTTGGSADAVVVSHTHTMESDGTHNHGLKYTNNGGSGTARSVMSSTGTNTSTGVITSDGAHTHTINSSGESGIGKNMPPYLAVYMWKRTA